MMNNPIIQLKEYREKNGLSQKQLAKILGVGQGYISKIENGVESPTVRMIYKFAETLSICPISLLPCIMDINNSIKLKCDCELNVNDSSDI